MIKNSFFSLFLPALIVYTNGLTLNSYVTPADSAKFTEIFKNALKIKPELNSIFYGLKGLQALNEKIADTNQLCEIAKKSLKEDDLEKLYFAAGVFSVLNTCKFTLSKAETFIQNSLNDPKTTAQDFYYAIFAAKNFKLKIDNAKASTVLQAAMKKNDTAANLGYIFHAAALLDEIPVDAFFAKIEDCVAQADEIDKKYLQIDGGLSSTAITVSGIYSLAIRAKKGPTVKPDEAVKLANFLLVRKGTKNLRPAYHVIAALQLLAVNPFQIPVAFTLASPLSVSSKNPNVKVRLVDVLGKSLGALTVVADSSTHETTKNVLFTKKQLKADSENKIYELNFADAKTERGFYKLLVSATSTDKKLVGTQGAEFSLKMTTEVTVENVEIAVTDRDQTGLGNNPSKIAVFSKLSTVLEGDVHQKCVMKFVIKDKTTNSLTKVHQAFVLFTHPTGRQITFIAEPDAKNVYSFDVDLEKSAKDFDFLNGKYAIKLLIGDFLINSPIDWHVADIKLTFPEQQKIEKSTVEHIVYQKKPEIEHMFRKPEPRPSTVVSDSFTILVLVPLLILLIIWFKIGANISNFSFSLNTIGFHLGFLGIFGVYLMFFWKLNMFQTLKYLAVISCFTFLTGNRMLKSMAERRKTKLD